MLNEGIRGLAGITPAELAQLPGIGRDKVLRLLAAMELAKCRRRRRPSAPSW
ncbi:MAG: hypothetical protein K6U04_09035 [Armatimonadetes bacterium]|nr:hypothetical protein [Armatimonadota bacterium]